MHTSIWKVSIWAMGAEIYCCFFIYTPLEMFMYMQYPLAPHIFLFSLTRKCRDMKLPSLSLPSLPITCIELIVGNTPNVERKKKENKTSKNYLLARVFGIFLCSFPFLSFQYWKSTEHIAVGKDEVMGV